MSLAVIDYKKCDPKNCDSGKCIAVDVCPVHALEQESSFDMPYVKGGCYACNKCINVCPLKAIQVV